MPQFLDKHETYFQLFSFYLTFSGILLIIKMFKLLLLYLFIKGYLQTFERRINCLMNYARHMCYM